MTESRPASPPPEFEPSDQVERDAAALGSAEDLDEDRLRVDPLEAGMEPPERWAASGKHGMTAAEQAETRPLDERLAEEQPDRAEIDSTETAAESDGRIPGVRGAEPAEPEEDADLDERVREEASRRGQAADEAGGSEASYYRTPHPPD